MTNQIPVVNQKNVIEKFSKSPSIQNLSRNSKINSLNNTVLENSIEVSDENFNNVENNENDNFENIDVSEDEEIIERSNTDEHNFSSSENISSEYSEIDSFDEKEIKKNNKIFLRQNNKKYYTTDDRRNYKRKKRSEYPNITEEKLGKIIAEHLSRKIELDESKSHFLKYEKLDELKDLEYEYKKQKFSLEYQTIVDEAKKLDITFAKPINFKSKLSTIAMGLDLYKSYISKKQETIEYIEWSKMIISGISTLLKSFGWADVKEEFTDPILLILNNKQDIFEDMVEENYPQGVIVKKKDSMTKLLSFIGFPLLILIVYKVFSYFSKDSGKVKTIKDIFNSCFAKGTILKQAVSKIDKNTAEKKSEEDFYDPDSSNNSATASQSSGFDWSSLAPLIQNVGPLISQFANK